MKDKSIILVFLAIALAAVAVWAIRAHQPSESSGGAGAAFLPELPQKASEIAKVEISQGEKMVVLEKKGAEWVVASSDGYTALPEPVRLLIVGLADLRIDEPLTARKDRLAELGLSWPDAENRARRVRVFGADSKPICDVVLGTEKAVPRSQYVRHASDDQAYRCLGSVTAEGQASAWLKRDLLSLQEKEVQSIAFMGLDLARQEKDGKTEWAGSITGDAAWSDDQLKNAKSSLPTFITRVEFDDVRRAGAEPPCDTDLTLIYGLKSAKVTMTGHKEGAAVWVRFDAEPTEAPSAAPAAAEPMPPLPAAAEPKPPDWADFAQRTRGWEFKLPEWKAGQLDRVRNPPPKPAPVPAGPNGFPAPPAGVPRAGVPRAGVPRAG